MGITKPWTGVVALVVATVSLCVSFFGLYFTWLAPFRPLVVVGGPVFQFGTATPANTAAATATTEEFDPHANRVLGGILLPVIILHEGGCAGVVSDILLRVTRSGNSDPWRFEPRLFLDEHAFLTSFDAPSTAKTVEASFSPIAVGRGQQAKRFILFQGDDHPAYPGGRLRVGQYKLDVLVRVNDRDDYELRDTIEIDLSREALANLDAGKFAPIPKSLISARARLK